MPARLHRRTDCRLILNVPTSVNVSLENNRAIMSHTFHSTCRPDVETQINAFADHIVHFLTSDVSPPRELPVKLSFVGPVTSTWQNFIFYNTEQLTRPSMLQRLIKFYNAHKASIAEVWDYAQDNIAIMNSHGIQARHVPLRLSAEQKEKLVSFIQNARRSQTQCDVGFCGGLSQRRLQILDHLRARGVRLLIVKSRGETRDRELARCRIMLNVHYDDTYRVFESVRCVPWLEVGVPVVSECSLTDDSRCVNASYDDLVDMVCKTLSQIDVDSHKRYTAANLGI